MNRDPVISGFLQIFYKTSNKGKEREKREREIKAANQEGKEGAMADKGKEPR